MPPLCQGHLPCPPRTVQGGCPLCGDGNSFFSSDGIAAIARAAYRTKSEKTIRGSGYVVESLEAALWAFARTDSFEDAVLMAANLGDDADTTAAVCGQLAGAYYGQRGIPSHWLERLALCTEITTLADQLLEKAEGAV